MRIFLEDPKFRQLLAESLKDIGDICIPVEDVKTVKFPPNADPVAVESQD